VWRQNAWTSNDNPRPMAVPKGIALIGLGISLWRDQRNTVPEGVPLISRLESAPAWSDGFADSEDPRVGIVLRRATERKQAILEDLFEQIHSESPAHRALLAYSAYLGLLQLRRSAPAVVPSGDELNCFIDQTLEWLVG